jgi:hypothetical protein
MNSFSAGFARPVVECEKCGAPTSLSLGVEKMTSIEKLPDPFSSKCSCGHEADYPKYAIKMLVSV